ncbi:hypothetical protein N9O61_06710 [Octadecabacter sp.]|nr:hypothetical protein [Octadecabacter sp.]
MKQQTALIIAGALIGFLIGSSMGLAFGGTAYNAAWFFTPLGAFIGWLIPSKQHLDKDISTVPLATSDETSGGEKVGNALATIFTALLRIMASLWNFQIDVLNVLGVLPTFVRQPLLFAGVCFVISIFFPPFLAIYFLAWLGANHFEMSEATNYRSVMK